MRWFITLWIGFGSQALADTPAIPEEALQTVSDEARAALEAEERALDAVEEELVRLRRAASAESGPSPVEVAQQAVKHQLELLDAARSIQDKPAAKAAKASLKAARAELDAALAAGAPAEPAAPAVDPAAVAALEARRDLLAAELELARARAVVEAGAIMDLAPYEAAVSSARSASGEAASAGAAGEGPAVAPEASARVE